MLNPIDYSISKFVSFATPATIDEIRAIAETKTFKKNASIATRGEKADHIYLIDQGLVQLGIHGIDGSRFNLTRLGEGHTFGESAFFLDQRVIHDAYAQSDVVLQKLSRENVDYLMTHSPAFSKALVLVACKRIQTTLSHIGDTLGLSLEARVAKQILSVSEGADGADIINVRQVDLAHSLGVSRVSIGKALKSLAQQELINIRYGKLEILKRDSLRAVITDAERQNRKRYQASNLV